MIINVPLCPACQSEMSIRMSTPKENTTTLFWGCSNYPRCTHTKSIADTALDSKKLHQLVHQALYFNTSRKYTSEQIFSTEDFLFVLKRYPKDPRTFFEWALGEMNKYSPGDLHNHDLGVGSPHTEALAGFVAYLQKLFFVHIPLESKLSTAWHAIIRNINIIE